MLFNMEKQKIPSKILSEKYIVPPFSVFNTHQPYWKDRMIMWRDMGFCGTNGRVTGMNGLSYDNRRIDKHKKKAINGTSTFNPVLTEIIYKWFVVPGGTVYDPFAGGITRGGIAAVLGLNYTGIDVNPIQVQDNQEKWLKMANKWDIKGSSEWVCADSVKYEPDKLYDLVFTCPPYYNLEVYSDNPADLSTKTDYFDFLDSYAKVLGNSYFSLKWDSFMVVVVSDVRDKETTAYYGLVADTIKLCQLAGLQFYNEIILYNETGNLAIVSGDYMDKARKVGRQHQNVLVFYKGDPKQIRNKFMPIEV